MGVELTSHCDWRIATTRATFAWNFVHRGLIPDTGAGTWLLPRQVGLSNALRLVLAGEPLEAEAALAMGYVHAVVAPDELAAAARAEAERLASVSPLSVALAKRLLQGEFSDGETVVVDYVGEFTFSHHEELALAS